jgi:hypothetical protein
MSESVKPAAWGFVAGAVALAIVGFSAGWVVWNGTAEKMANARAEKAVLAAMTPICVAQFKRDSKAEMSPAADKNAMNSRSALLAALLKEDSWKRGAFVIKHGWARMPGSDRADSDVASACASELTKLASAAEKN